MGMMADALKKAGLVSESKVRGQEERENQELKQMEDSSKWLGALASIEQKEQKREERHLARAARESGRRSNSRESKEYLKRFK